MLSVPTRLKIAAALGAAAVLLLLLGYGCGYGRGSTKATERAAVAMDAYREEVRKREREQARLLERANRENREQEIAHEQRVADLRAEYALLEGQARSEDKRTIDDLRSGNQRLRLQVASCGSGAGTANPSAGGADGAGTAELAPEASAAVWGIAADGDGAIRKLTALQSWARSALKTCNGRENEP